MSSLGPQVYLAKTKNKPWDKELLFISYKEAHKGDLHKNTLSGWVRKLIHHFYKTAVGDVPPLANVRTYEVHTLAIFVSIKGQH